MISIQPTKNNWKMSFTFFLTTVMTILQFCFFNKFGRQLFGSLKFSNHLRFGHKMFANYVTSLKAGRTTWPSRHTHCIPVRFCSHSCHDQ